MLELKTAKKSRDGLLRFLLECLKNFNSKFDRAIQKIPDVPSINGGRVWRDKISSESRAINARTKTCYFVNPYDPVRNKARYSYIPAYLVVFGTD